MTPRDAPGGGDRFDPYGVCVCALTDLSNKRDISQLEDTSWVLSSAKPRFGIAQLLSPDLDSLWQCVATDAGATVYSHIP